MNNGMKRIVIIGGGFAGLNLVKHLDSRYYDITLIVRNNYHSFQVASAGLEPASICFPFRRELRKRHKSRVHFLMETVRTIDTVKRVVTTAMGETPYDILVVAAGTTNNFFNMPDLEKKVYTIKSTPEALRCRNGILALLERAAAAKTSAERRKLLRASILRLRRTRCL